MKKDSIDKTDLIAPCGMNCAICGSYLSLMNDIKIKELGFPTVLVVGQEIKNVLF